MAWLITCIMRWLFTPRGQTFRSSQPRCWIFRPELEALEGRIAPALLLTWTGKDSNDWNVATNWQVAGKVASAAPTPADDVEIANGIRPCQETGSITVNKLTIAAMGHLDISGELTMTGTVQDVGEIDVFANAVLKSSAQVTIGGTAKSSIYLYNGTVQGSTIVIQQSGKIIVNPGSLFPNMGGNVLPSNGTLIGTVVNNGSIIIDSNTGVQKDWQSGYLSITGDYGETKTSTIKLNVYYVNGQIDSSDVIMVSGAASLAGSLLVTSNGVNPGTSTYSVLTNKGVRTGTFSNYTIPLPNKYVPDYSEKTWVSIKPTMKAQLGLPSNTQVVTSVSPANEGQSVTFTATVTGDPNGPTPTGTVTFYDNYEIGTVPLNANGVAALDTSSLSGGTQDIEAVYNGDSTYDNTEADVQEIVNALIPTTTVTADNTSTTYGAPVTFTATVSGSGAGSTPSGIVDFYADGTWQDEENLLPNGTASFSPATPLLAGSHSITAEYNGDATYLDNTSPVLTEWVNTAPAPTTLTESTPTSQYGQSVTLTAHVAGVVGGVEPTGPVTFTEVAPSGYYSTYLGQATLDANGNASLIASNLAVGVQTLTAYYSMDSNYYGGMPATAAETVHDDTTTTLSLSATTTNYGQSVTLQATIAGLHGGPTTTGNVTFFDGSTALGTVALVMGSASFPTSSLTLGTHSLQAVYSGDAIFNASSSDTDVETVQQVATNVSLWTSSSSSYLTDPVTFSASVSSMSGTPIGTVEFDDTIGTNNVVALGSAPVNASTYGSVSFTTTALGLGSHSITAIFTPTDSVQYAGSVSAVVTQTVSQVSTYIYLWSYPSTSYLGDSVTVSGYVGSVTGVSGALSGAVQFYDNGSPVGSATVDASSYGSFSFTTTALALGSHPITASFTPASPR